MNEEEKWVFDNESYSNDEGIDLDTDKVEQVMKHQPGARYIGDVRDKSFIPVGYHQPVTQQSKKVSLKRPKGHVEYTKPGLHKKTFKHTTNFFSKLENFVFAMLKKIRF